MLGPRQVRCKLTFVFILAAGNPGCQPSPAATSPAPPCLQLGRFTLRDEGKTIAIGKVLRVPKRGGAPPAE